MLSIEYNDVEEQVWLGELFDQIEFYDSAEQSDDSGDSFIKNQWPIEVKGFYGYFPIEGFRWTKPEKQVKLFHSDGILVCSPEHIVATKPGEFMQWIKVCDLVPGDQIIFKCDDDAKCCDVLRVEDENTIERLCDLQVSTVNSYYTNDVLSHNSHFLVMLGANAMRNGINVLHYTLELSEESVGIRYDSNLCDIDSSYIIENKDNVVETYKKLKLGRLIIKGFPPNTATVHTLRAHIERLSLHGFVPGLIIIDYADVMRSTRQFDSLRHELKLIYEELRGLAMEKKLAIWSASQSNKEGSNNDIVDLSNMSEAYGKAMTADFVASISRKSFEKSLGQGRLYVAKNRFGRDGLVYPIKIDTARSKFEITGKAGGIEEATTENESDMKKAIKAKWRELQNDTVIGARLKDNAGDSNGNST